jgi:2-polyprenyl-6-methoxyphenol hydroxylase-like FAD-dependent oxidoreductase
MEFARRWGLVSEIEHGGFPRDLPLSIVYTTGVLGLELARDVGPTLETSRLPSFSPQKHELCPQNFFDPVMQQAARSYSTNEILFHHRLVDFVDRGDHVLAELSSAGGEPPIHVRAEYLAACDGAGSFVAGRLGLRPDIHRVLSCSTNVFISCPELALRTSHQRAYRYILVGVEGTWGSFVNMNGRDVWRLQLLGGDTWPNWPEAEIREKVRRGIGEDVPFDILSWTPWERRELVVDRYSVGRCFLIGDSAHQLSPTGGYGMNTGIAEAVDFGWKVDAVLKGWGGPALLGSYEAERRPIAIRNVRQGSENLAAMRSVPGEPRLLDLDETGQAARERVGALTRRAMQREWRSFGIHLGAIYWDSPIIAHDGPRQPDDDVAAFVQRAYPGARAPHVWLTPERSTLDLFGRGFVLLDFVGAEAEGLSDLMAAASRAKVPLRCETIAEPRAAEIYERAYVLVRPDGHIAWRGDSLPKDPDALVELVSGGNPADEPTA